MNSTAKENIREKKKTVGEKVKKQSTSSKSSYKVYITASSEAAALIAKGLQGVDLSRIGGKVLKIESGNVSEDKRIPKIYHDTEMYFALMEYDKGVDTEYPEYSIIFC